ncbi:hypothetical protein SCALM49S_06477 [Streptomyces californicus]
MTTTAPESASYLRPVILSVSCRTVFMACASSYSATACTRASRLVTRVEPATAGVVLRLAHDAAEVVDLVAGDARLAAQFLVVGALDAGAADLVGAQVGRRAVLGLLDLLVGDGREIAENLRRLRLGGCGVAAYGGGFGGDAGEVLGALADLEGLLGGGLVGDRDRLVGRSVPAGLGGVFASQRRTLSWTSFAFMPRTSASSVRTPTPSSFIFASSVRLAETTRRVSSSARGTPRASRIEPRTAGWTTCCTPLPAASAVYSSPLRIWRYQRRPPRVSSREKTRTWMTMSRI